MVSISIYVDLNLQRADQVPPGGFFVFGYTLAAWVGVGSYYSTNVNFNWRFPLSLQVLWPLLQLCFIPWLPESPRWRKSSPYIFPTT